MSECKECNSILDKVMDELGDTQMQREEYAYVASFLKESNFLVFGTGHDSKYWKCVNSRGNTVFLEDVDEWIEFYGDGVLKVTYNTVMSEYEKLMKLYLKGNTSKLEMRLPKEIRDTKWDVIFVDGPVGNCYETAPGRMQSIFTAYQLANSKTHVIVHDCDRPVEDLYTSKIFKNKVKDLVKLRQLRK